MPFGLKNAPADFQRLMELVLRGLQWESCLVYLDDIIIFSDTFEEHLGRLDSVLKALEKANLRLKPKKCCFLQKEVKFLGYIISSNGIQPDPDRMRVLLNLPLPKTIKQLQSFLGLAQCFRRFVPKLAEIAEPLYELLK